MPDSLLYQEWFEKAAKDLRAAKILYEHAQDEHDYGLVAFHCRQTIEKAMKGLILQKSNKLVSGHSLLYLHDYITDFCPNFTKFKKDLTFVDKFYIDTRYPQETFLRLSGEHALECIKIAEEILNTKEI